MRAEERKVKSIKTTHYVRADYNLGYLGMLCQSIRCGESLPEVVIDENGKVQEGRHTQRAMEMEGVEKALYKVVPIAKNFLEEAIRSTEGHTKSKLPLMPEDYVYTFKELLLDGFSTQDITKAYREKRFLSPGRIRDYLMSAQGAIYNAKWGPALALMKTGKSLPEIATTLSLSVEFLKNKLTEMEKNRKKQNSKQTITPIKHFKGLIDRRFKTVRNGMDRDFRTLKQKCQVGLASSEDYKEALQYSNEKIQLVLNLLEDKTKRFNKEIKV